MKLRATIFAAIIAAISLTHSTGAVTVGSDWSIKTFQSTVTVLDHNGDPLDGARVDLLRANGSATGKWAKTGADGSGVAGFDILPGFSHAFKVTWNRGFIVTGLLDPDEDVVVETQLSQIVLQKKTGEPIEGARVDMLLPDGTATGKWMKSQADGFAGFETLPGCNAMFKVTYHGDSFVSDLVPCGHVATLEVGVAANTIEVTFQESDFDAIENARLDLLKENGKGSGVWKKTDSEGKVVFDVVPGAKHRVKFRYHGGTYIYSNAENDSILTAGAQITVKAVASTLTLTSSAPSPIDSVRVDLLKANDKGAGVWTKTGRGSSSGVAHFEVLPNFSHKLKVRYHGGTYITPAAVDIAVDGTHNEMLQTVASTLAFTSSAGSDWDSIRVDLLNSSNRGTGTWTKTSRITSGVAHFEVLPDWAHALRVRFHGGYDTTAVAAIALEGSNNADLQTVASVLTLLDDGTPKGNVRVDLLKANAKGAGAWTKTDETTGEATIEVLPEFPHILRARIGSKKYSTAVLIGAEDATIDIHTTLADGEAPAAKLATGSGEVAFGLNQNHPNPFNPSTTINYGLAEASDVRLVIYNILGQEVKVLVSEYLPLGGHSIQWDGRDAIGRTVASGTYIYRLAAGDKVAIKKMIFAK